MSKNKLTPRKLDLSSLYHASDGGKKSLPVLDYERPCLPSRLLACFLESLLLQACLCLCRMKTASVPQSGGAGVLSPGPCIKLILPFLGQSFV